MYIHFVQIQYGKDYQNENEEVDRRAIFLSNKLMIDEHNAKYANGEKSFSLGLNHFADMTKKEFEQMRGFNMEAIKK